MTGIMAVNMFSTTVSAANVSDTTYGYELSTSNPVAYTYPRAKQNTSSTYVNVKKVPSVYVYCEVEGYRPTPISGTNIWTNETVGGDAVTLSVGKWLVRQNVYEHGGRSARLKFKKYLMSGTVSGVWSPDSAGSYPYAN